MRWLPLAAAACAWLSAPSAMAQATDGGATAPVTTDAGATAPPDDRAAPPASDEGGGLFAAEPLPERASGAPEESSTAAEAPARPPFWKTSGEVAFEGRAFVVPDHRSDTRDWGAGIFGRLSLAGGDDHFAVKARGYGRADSQDPGRSLAVLEELWAEARSASFALRVGFDVLNWSATEAFHPADVVNARNFDSDFERYEKIGEPMAALSYRWETGNVTAYWFPHHSFPIFPSPASRLNPFPQGIPLGGTWILGRDGHLTGDRLGLQGALRLSQKIGSADVSLHAISHMDHTQPELVFDPATKDLHPLLRYVTQVGGTYQQVLEPFVLKLEAAYRKFSNPAGDDPRLAALPNRDHFEIAAGIEYGWLWGRAESTLILEGQSFFGAPEGVLRSTSLLWRDALVGYRLALGDTASTTFTFFGIVDVDDPTQFFLLGSVERRVIADVQLGLAVRTAFGLDDVSSHFVPKKADYVQLRLTRYF